MIRLITFCVATITQTLAVEDQNQARQRGFKQMLPLALVTPSVSRIEQRSGQYVRGSEGTHRSLGTKPPRREVTAGCGTTVAVQLQITWPRTNKHKKKLRTDKARQKKKGVSDCVRRIEKHRRQRNLYAFSSKSTH